MADQRLLIRQSQPTCRRSAGNNERLRLDRIFAHLKRERTFAEVRRSHMRQFVFGAKTLRLAAHIGNQLWALNSVRKSGKIFHQRGQRKLAAGLVPFQYQRIQLCPCRVKRGGVPGAA